MRSVIGDLLPLAIGVALSPVPIIAAILMIMSKNAGGAAKGFAVGWVAGILIVTTVVTLLAGSLSDSGDEDPTASSTSWVKIVLGLALLALAALLVMGGLAIAGPSGLLAWSENLRLLDQREAQLATLEAEREALENRVALLDPNHADPDMVGELLRSQLNVVHPDEVVIKLED